MSGLPYHSSSNSDYKKVEGGPGEITYLHAFILTIVPLVIVFPNSIVS